MGFFNRLFGGRKMQRTAVETAQDLFFSLPGGVKLAMVSIRPGTFMMGSPPSEQWRVNDETQHRVTLTKGFELGKYLVTQRQWEAVTGANPSLFARAGSSSPDCPVEGVSWGDCQIFLNALNSALGGDLRGEFRLPTEAEWEYACRAGTTGAVYGRLNEIAWYSQNSKGSTNPVGLKQPNGWGLHDMIGNVWEWCEDWYGDDASEGPPIIDYIPGSATDPTGRKSGKFRVRRGGGWEDRPMACRSARRNYNSPNLRHDFLGLRVARTLP